MTVQAFLVFRWTFEFPDMAFKTLCDSGAVGAFSHVFMACIPVTVHAFQALITVIAVIKLDDPFFNFVIEFEDIQMTVQTSLGNELIVCQVFRWRQLVAEVLENIPPFRSEFESPGMTLVAICLVPRMSV